ncbi:MAG: hypothetical protein WA814_09840 [Candidatus Baltobacteraceae bacterium]
MNDRGFRLDFAIAIGALLISTVAAAASVYQTRVIAQQFSATVWPYLSFDQTNSPSLLEVTIANDGLGPAIIRAVTISWNGKREASLETLVADLAREPRSRAESSEAARAHLPVKLMTSTPTIGMVIPANSQHTIFRMEGSPRVQAFRPGIARIDVSLCYCSLTGNCWVNSFQNREALPRAVHACS